MKKFIMCLCVWEESLCTLVLGLWRSEGGAGPQEAEVTGSFELPNVGAGN